MIAHVGSEEGGGFFSVAAHSKGFVCGGEGGTLSMFEKEDKDVYKVPLMTFPRSVDKVAKQYPRLLPPGTELFFLDGVTSRPFQASTEDSIIFVYNSIERTIIFGALAINLLC